MRDMRGSMKEIGLRKMRRILKSAEVRAVKDPGSGWKTQINVDGEWLDLCRQDECDEVMSYTSLDSPEAAADDVEQKLKEGWYAIIYDDMKVFSVVDSGTDG